MGWGDEEGEGGREGREVQGRGGGGKEGWAGLEEEEGGMMAGRGDGREGGPGCMEGRSSPERVLCYRSSPQ